MGLKRVIKIIFKEYPYSIFDYIINTENPMI